MYFGNEWSAKACLNATNNIEKEHLEENIPYSHDRKMTTPPGSLERHRVFWHFLSSLGIFFPCVLFSSLKRNKRGRVLCLKMCTQRGAQFLLIEKYIYCKQGGRTMCPKVYSWIMGVQRRENRRQRMTHERWHCHTDAVTQSHQLYWCKVKSYHLSKDIITPMSILWLHCDLVELAHGH